MSARVNIENDIYGDILVLSFIGKENTHAFYKCLCMLCNETLNTTYSNLISGNTKSCASCGQKITTYSQDCLILQMINYEITKTEIAKFFGVSRGTIYRIEKENLTKG